MRDALLYLACLLATAITIRAEAHWLGNHLDQAGRAAGVIVLAVLE
ncbi:hypothetical protein ACVWW6_005551 [Bradyrhizobium sp. USDA 3311]